MNINMSAQNPLRHSTGLTTEGAGEWEAGVMRDFSSSIFHICRVHCKHMLQMKETQGHTC